MHRLWEPLAAKQRPPNGYAGKFSTPYCIAAGFVRGNVGLDAFTDDAVHDPRGARARRQGALSDRSAKSLSERVHRPHPRCCSTTAAWSRNASRICAAARRSRSRAADIEDKFVLNARHGGWDEARAKQALALLRKLYDGRVDLSPLRG